MWTDVNCIELKKGRENVVNAKNVVVYRYRRRRRVCRVDVVVAVCPSVSFSFYFSPCGWWGFKTQNVMKNKEKIFVFSWLSFLNSKMKNKKNYTVIKCNDLHVWNMSSCWNSKNLFLSLYQIVWSQPNGFSNEKFLPKWYVLYIPSLDSLLSL